MIAIKPIPQCAQLTQLLAACNLPVADIFSSGSLQLFGAFSGPELIGAAGLESYAPVALLRSVAVSPAQRRSGVGEALVAFTERYAAEQGIAALYLLTTTAAPFFLKRGYAVASRANAPAAIQATAQFSGLCPRSATLMVKHRLA